MKVAVELDLETRPGRAAMRAWLDARDVLDVPPEVTVGTLHPYVADFLRDRASSDPAGEDPADMPPAGCTDDELGTTPGANEIGPGDARHDSRREAHAGPGVASPRCSGGAGADGPPQDSLQAKAGEPRPSPNLSESAGRRPADTTAEGVACSPDAEASPELNSSGEADPKRAWTADDQSRAWAMWQHGIQAKEIAQALRRDTQQIHNYVWRVRNGKTAVPPPLTRAEGALVVAGQPSRDVAVRDEDRPAGFGGIAKDADVQAMRHEEALDGERREFVRRTLYPDVR